MEYYNTHVVTKNLIRDWLAGIKNLLGLRLTSYEDVINEAIEELIKDMKSKGKMNWYRLSINEITNGAIMIIIYGDVHEQKR